MDIQKNVLLADYTTFHIGGPADEFIIVNSVDELVEAIEYADKKSLPFFVLGTGANILVGDKGYRGVVIKNQASQFELSSDSSPSPALRASPPEEGIEGRVFLTVESGAVMSDLIGFTAKKGLSGLEHFAGIPSTVGGALWQNLHFLSPDRKTTVYIGDVLEKAEILSMSSQFSVVSSQKEVNQSSVRQTDELKTEKLNSENRKQKTDNRKIVDRDYFQFGYDDSVLHHNKDVVLTATFQLTPKDPQEIENTIDANLKWREDKHPPNATHCSAGSVFRKIELASSSTSRSGGHGAGRLIEQVGLKGHKIGGAQISEKHANFIINTGNASAKDVRDLIELVEKKVKEELGLTMIPEISMVGEF